VQFSPLEYVEHYLPITPRATSSMKGTKNRNKFSQ
jgi:hypothetical protein